MSDKPFIAARAEEWINRRAEIILRLCGWREHVQTYPGYGSAQQLRVTGRVVLVPPKGHTQLARDLHAMMTRRGWRNFFVAPCVNAPARILVGDRIIPVWSDRGGYIDERITGHDLEPGWQTVPVESRLSKPCDAPVQVVSESARTGIISDIDDTVIATQLPRLFIAAWNSFVLTEQARNAIPGMAEMYEALLERYGDAPFFYVSTGSFDTVPFLQRFLRRHKFPVGSMLMTDWGPTNTGWFRSGAEHKRRALRTLARDFPDLKWILIGDDGQHDPTLYGEFAARLPKRVRVIGIRQLTATEHTLAHGTPEPRAEQGEEDAQTAVAEVRAPDGFGLLPSLLDVLDRQLARKQAKQAKRLAKSDVD